MAEKTVLLKDVPFYPNDEAGVQCAQVAMKIALEYFLKKEFSLNELDQFTGRKGNFWTWTTQIVPVLYDLGLHVKFYSLDALEPMLEGEEWVRKNADPKNVENILAHMDILTVVESAKKMMKYKLFELRGLTLDEIQEHIEKGRLVMLTIDHSILMKNGKPYAGHMVIVTGFDEKHIYYHESGPNNPTANKKVLKEDFEAARTVKETGRDTVVVFGKQKGGME